MLASVLCLASSCQHAKETASDPRLTLVGPVPLSELVDVLASERLLRKLVLTDAGYVDTERPVVPFTIVVAHLAFPEEAEGVQCTWGPKGELVRYQAIYRNPSTSEGARSRAQLIDAGASAEDIEWSEEMEIGPDGDRPFVAFRFDDLLHPTSTPALKRERDPASRRTYWVAPLCAEGARAGILVSFVDGPMDAQGWLLVLRNSGTRWEVMSVVGKWQS